MSTGRALLAELIGPAFTARLGAGADLVRSGVNSGDLVRLALLLEERYGVALSAHDLEELRTVDGIEALVDRLEAGGAVRSAADAAPIQSD